MIKTDECDRTSSEMAGHLRQVIAGVTGSLCMFLAGCWIAWPSPALKNLLTGNARVQLDEYQASWVVSLLDMGNNVSPIPVAYLVDRLGRKTLMLSTGPLFLACSLLTFPTGSVYYIYLARFLAGVTKGIVYTVSPMYLGEIASVNIRGAMITICFGFNSVGILFMFSVGPLVSYDTLNIIIGIIPLIFFLTFIWMPESPYLLLMRDNYSEAKKSLEWLRHGSSNTEKELIDMKKQVEEEMKTKGTYLELITIPSNRKAMWIVMVIASFQRLTGVSSIISYSSTTLPLSSGLFFLGQKEIIIGFGLSLAIGCFMATPLVDSLGRKPLLVVSSISCTICTAATGVYYLLVPTVDKLGWIPYLSLLIFGMFQTIGLGSVPSTLLAELFPTNVKSKAAAIASIVFAASSFLTNKMYIPVKNNYGVYIMYFFFSFNGVIALLFTIIAVFETKGKTFPEIQDKLKRK